MPFDQPFEYIDEFERELREGLKRQPAPVTLKHKVMERRGQNRGQILSICSAQRRRNRMISLERIAASLVLAGVAGSAAIGHYAVERRKGEEAKQQVFTALRITNHALGQVGAQLAEHDNKE
ncbi:MAG: hypothetical protein ACLP07_13915 [Terracidiphilus sp.]